MLRAGLFGVQVRAKARDFSLLENARTGSEAQSMYSTCTYLTENTPSEINAVEGNNRCVFVVRKLHTEWAFNLTGRP
jgi:hypothetical protein